MHICFLHFELSQCLISIGRLTFQAIKNAKKQEMVKHVVLNVKKKNNQILMYLV